MALKVKENQTEFEVNFLSNYYKKKPKTNKHPLWVTILKINNINSFQSSFKWTVSFVCRVEHNKKNTKGTILDTN